MAVEEREERGLLDAARWVSAIAVAVGHTWGLFVRQAPGYLPDLLAGAGHYAVVIFFVLSGYLVGGGMLARRDGFDLRRYAIARFSRIYIVLIPALLLAAALDVTVHGFDAANPIYASHWPGGVMGEVPVFDRYGAHEIAASVLSLEGFVGAPMGSAGPLWSLGFEWVFYFAFPAVILGAGAVARRLKAPETLAAAGAVLAAAALLALDHKLYLGLLWLIWCGGALASRLAAGGLVPAGLRWLGLPVCAAGVLISPLIGYRLADPLIGFGFAFFLSAWPKGETGLNAAADLKLAQHSYSLYVIHLPVVAFVAFLFYRAHLLTAAQLAPGPLALLEVTVALGAAAAATIAFERLFERRTDALRTLLQRVTAPRKPAAQASRA